MGTCPTKSSRKWKSGNVVGSKCSAWQRDRGEARRPYIIFIYKKEHKGIIIDIAVPADVRVEEKERVKMEK